VTYCTIQDVVSIAVEYERQVEGINPSITLDQQTRVLERASDEVLTILRPFYKKAVIDAYAPDFPPAVVTLTAYVGARILVQTYQNAIAPEQQNILLERWEKSQCIWRDEIVNSALLDIAGNLVPAAISASLGRLSSSTTLQGVIGARRY
jgi:hypothetical protein